MKGGSQKSAEIKLLGDGWKIKGGGGGGWWDSELHQPDIMEGLVLGTKKIKGMTMGMNAGNGRG